jgi:hypothetical protein
MHRVGDDRAGFSVETSEDGGVKVTGWGFLSLEVAVALAPAVVEACRSRPRGSALILELSNLKPMREEGQRSFTHILRSTTTFGFSSVSITTTNPLTKLQLVRLATGTGANVRWFEGTNDQGRGA